MAVRVLSAASDRSILSLESAVERLRALAPLEDGRLPLVGFVLKEASRAVERYLAPHHVGIFRDRVEMAVAWAGETTLHLPRRPLVDDAESIEVDRGDERVAFRILDARNGRLSIDAGHGRGRGLTTFRRGRFGMLYPEDVDDEITVRAWIGYEAAEIPEDVQRAAFVTLRTWLERDSRPSEMAFEQGLHTTRRWKSADAALPTEARALLDGFAATFSELVP